MASGDVGTHNEIDQEQAWRILIELTLTRESGNACWAADQVAGAMQPLNWPAAHLEQLKLALVKAAWNVMERSRLYGSDTPLIIRVLIPKDYEATQEADQTSDKPSQYQTSERADQKSSRGWGFFLVQKQEDEPKASAEESQYMIEVFLYQESEGFRKYR